MSVASAAVVAAALVAAFQDLNAAIAAAAAAHAAMTAKARFIEMDDRGPMPTMASHGSQSDLKAGMCNS